MSAQWIKAMLADDAEVDDLGNIVEEGEWINDMKWQHKTDIVKLGDNKVQFVGLPFEEGFYMVIQSRSGSYWSDYEYSDPVVSKVEPYTETVTITKYRAVE